MGIFDEFGPIRPPPAPPKNFSGLKKVISQNQFVTASGLPSFDNLLGGGVAMGSSSIFVEDMHCTYVRFFMKLFAAQGLICHHHLCYISPIDRLESFVKDLPGLADYSNESSTNAKDRAPEEALDIAWRYKNTLPSSTAPKSSALSREFDMSKTLQLDQLNSTIEQMACEFRVDPLVSLETNLQSVLEHIAQLPSTNQTFVTRITINSLGSPLWGTPSSGDVGKLLSRFMIRLRLLLRNSFNLVYISIPKLLTKHLEPELQLMTYADYVYELEGFDGREESAGIMNPLYQEYNGLLTVLRLPSLSRMNLEPVARPLTVNWVFKVKRKQFIVQCLSLPPCLSDTASRTNTADSTILCGVGKSAALDF